MADATVRLPRRIVGEIAKERVKALGIDELQREAERHFGGNRRKVIVAVDVSAAGLPTMFRIGIRLDGQKDIQRIGEAETWPKALAEAKRLVVRMPQGLQLRSAVLKPIITKTPRDNPWQS